MNTSERPDTQNVSKCLQPLVDRMKLARRVTDAELNAKVEDLLYGKKRLWDAVALNIVTRRETACAVAANIESWLMDREHRSWTTHQPFDDTELIESLERALFSTT